MDFDDLSKQNTALREENAILKKEKEKLAKITHECDIEYYECGSVYNDFARFIVPQIADVKVDNTIQNLIDKGIREIFDTNFLVLYFMFNGGLVKLFKSEKIKELLDNTEVMNLLLSSDRIWARLVKIEDIKYKVYQGFKVHQVCASFLEELKNLQVLENLQDLTKIEIFSVVVDKLFKVIVDKEENGSVYKLVYEKSVKKFYNNHVAVSELFAVHTFHKSQGQLQLYHKNSVEILFHNCIAMEELFRVRDRELLYEESVMVLFNNSLAMSALLSHRTLAEELFSNKVAMKKLFTVHDKELLYEESVEILFNNSLAMMRLFDLAYYADSIKMIFKVFKSLSESTFKTSSILSMMKAIKSYIDFVEMQVWQQNTIQYLNKFFFDMGYITQEEGQEIYEPDFRDLLRGKTLDQFTEEIMQNIASEAVEGQLEVIVEEIQAVIVEEIQEVIVEEIQEV